MTDTAPGSAPNGDGQGTPNPAPTSSAAALTGAPPVAAPAPGAAPAPTGNWLDGVDDVTKGYVQNKGWEKPTQVLESYRNLEKLLGADKAGNAVILPKPDAPQAEMDAFYNRLGRPAEPAGYNLPVPEKHGDPEFAKEASTIFHKFGVSKTAAEGITTWWNEKMGGAIAAKDTQRQADFEAGEQAIRNNWGAAFQQNLALAQNAARGLGLDEAKIDRLQDALGHQGLMELLHKIGSKTGEAGFVSGDKTEQFGSAMTPAQAKAKIAELVNDKAFATRYRSKDAAAVEEMGRLHRFAFPE